MLGVFKKAAGDPERGHAEHAVRHSRGWGELNKVLHASEGLRVLDFGSTSPANINYLTQLGHSVYMAHAVSDAASPEWRKAAPGDKQGDAVEFDTQRFCASNLDFAGRVFDVILLWDTANYLPTELVPVLFKRLGDVLQPGGRLLAFFHARTDGPAAPYARYQLTDSEDLNLLRSGSFPIQGLYQSRQIERFCEGYADLRFYLGKDNIRELYALR